MFQFLVRVSNPAFRQIRVPVAPIRWAVREQGLHLTAELRSTRYGAVALDPVRTALRVTVREALAYQ
jgi:hypothetical protein